jgi:hypothetical protein
MTSNGRKQPKQGLPPLLSRKLSTSSVLPTIPPLHSHRMAAAKLPSTRFRESKAPNHKSKVLAPSVGIFGPVSGGHGIWPDWESGQ